MKKLMKSLGAGVALAAVLVSPAMADPTAFPVPEPSTLPLVGLAVAAAIYVLRRKK